MVKENTEAAEKKVSGSVYAPADPAVSGGESLRFAIVEYIDGKPEDIEPFELSGDWLTELKSQLKGYTVTSLRPHEVKADEPYIALFSYGDQVFAANVDAKGKSHVFGKAPLNKENIVQALTISKVA